MEPRHARAEPFSEGLGGVRDDAGRFGYVTPSGGWAVEPIWLEEAHPFRGGLALVKLNGLYGYLDSAGRLAIPPRYRRAEPFSDGLAATAVARKPAAPAAGAPKVRRREGTPRSRSERSLLESF